MEKIEFKNNSEPYLSAENLNKIQDSIENDIDNLKETINGIIESGSNEKGSYIKFPDGTLICTGKKTYSAEGDFVQDGSNNIFIKDLGEYVFPMEFIDVPVVNVINVNANYTRRTWLGGIANVSKTKIGHITLCTYWNASNAGGSLHIQAIGRWK